MHGHTEAHPGLDGERPGRVEKVRLCRRGECRICRALLFSGEGESEPRPRCLVILGQGAPQQALRHAEPAQPVSSHSVIRVDDSALRLALTEVTNTHFDLGPFPRVPVHRLAGALRIATQGSLVPEADLEEASIIQLSVTVPQHITPMGAAMAGDLLGHHHQSWLDLESGPGQGIYFTMASRWASLTQACSRHIITTCKPCKDQVDRRMPWLLWDSLDESVVHAMQESAAV